ncbi:NAD(P)-dependent oxidoreductase [Lichenihabitans psoromatis]|uniref:NAD(P)-dependent oxidoreductase n=1 Tax=Lichenihabitans psoromatis TaxID=2528642 RepID=UPI00103834C2|nr:NAD(P)-dependent oxidoreductase [Lichenihabitans psoromatis]
MSRPTTRQGPDARQPIRMERLATLPIFLKLGKKRAVMAGGSLPAVWKAELLSACGADVTIFTAEPCPELLDLVVSPPGGPIDIVARDWRPDDLVGAAVAIGAIEEEADATAFRDAARQAGVPVNVIDKPAFCDFQFGTIVGRSPLVIGISTDGAAPVFGQVVRARIEALLPQGLRRWAEAARDWRPAVQAYGFDFRSRRRFWEAFTNRAFAAVDKEPLDADFDACRDAALSQRAALTAASVVLVGAGSGHPDDMTLRGIRALQTADVVIHGSDVAEPIVAFARREAVKVVVDAPLGSTLPVMVQEQLQPGRRVAWLDRGNPDLCKRWLARAVQLAAGSVTVETTSGLGLCPDCTPDCPAWIKLSRR